MKHTKGPWKVTNSHNGPASIAHAEDSYTVICRLDAKDPQIILNNKANAHLIAAAPEMLEALELAANILMNAGQKPLKGNNFYIIAQAIKKARGE